MVAGGSGHTLGILFTWGCGVPPLECDRNFD